LRNVERTFFVAKYQRNAEGELKRIEGKVDEERTEIVIKLPSLSESKSVASRMKNEPRIVFIFARGKTQK